MNNQVSPLFLSLSLSLSLFHNDIGKSFRCIKSPKLGPLTEAAKKYPPILYIDYEINNNIEKRTRHS